MLRSITAESGVAFELRVCEGEQTERGGGAIWRAVEGTEVEDGVEVEVDIDEDGKGHKEVEVGDD